MPGFHVSHLAGIVFAIAWGVWIDCWIVSNKAGSNTTAEHFEESLFRDLDAYWALGILSTVGLIILNTIGWSALTATEHTFGKSQAQTLRCKSLSVLFLSVLCFVGAIAGSVWVLVVWAKTELLVLSIYLLVQNLLVTVSAVLLRLDGNPSTKAPPLIGYGT
jgi:hypothetical protein